MRYLEERWCHLPDVCRGSNVGETGLEELVLPEADVWLVGVSMCREGGFEEAGRKMQAHKSLRSR